MSSGAYRCQGSPSPARPTGVAGEMDQPAPPPPTGGYFNETNERYFNETNEQGLRTAARRRPVLCVFFWG